MERYLPEVKMTCRPAVTDAALALLAHYCIPDPEFPAGEIYSIYYDTPAQHAYHDKANGDFIKSKARLRWYKPDVSPDPARSTAFFELKRKRGGGRSKFRKTVSLDREWLYTAALGDAGFMDVLDAQRAELGDELPPDLFPLLVVKYTRFRYVYPALGVRVALDTRIGSGRINPAFLPHENAGEIAITVLEIKSDLREELPWLHAMFSLGFRERSFSKYGACVARLMGDEQSDE